MSVYRRAFADTILAVSPYLAAACQGPKKDSISPNPTGVAGGTISTCRPEAQRGTWGGVPGALPAIRARP